MFQDINSTKYKNLIYSLVISEIKKQGISQFSPTLYGKSEKSPYLCEKSKPFGEKVCYIAKKYIIAEKYAYYCEKV